MLCPMTRQPNLHGDNCRSSDHEKQCNGDKGGVEGYNGGLSNHSSDQKSHGGVARVYRVQPFGRQHSGRCLQSCDDCRIPGDNVGSKNDVIGSDLVIDQRLERRDAQQAAELAPRVEQPDASTKIAGRKIAECDQRDREE